MERYSVSFGIQSECGKIRTRKNFVFGHFSRSVGVNFGNSILDNSNWDKISEGIIKKIQIWNRVRLSLRGTKIIVNQILFSKLVKYILFENISKRNLKKHTISYGMEKSLAQLSIWTGGLGILDINTLLNFLKIIQRLLNPISGKISCCIV